MTMIDGESDEVRFRLLGPVEVWIAGRCRPLGGPRQQKLLAALLLSGDRLVSSGAVVDALWDEDPPGTARKQVHNAVAALRRSLGTKPSLIVTEGSCYRVGVAAHQVDVYCFSTGIASAGALADAGDRAGAIRVLTNALALWRGQPLAGLTGRFIEIAASRLAEQRLSAREALIDLRLADGEADGLVPELLGLLSEHPLRERLARQLMTALYHAGRQSDALDVYEQTRARLAEELGIDPGADLRLLHGQILRADPVLRSSGPAARHTTRSGSADRRVRCDLPRDIPDFTGRADAVDHVLSLIRSAHDTAVVITAVDGMAGVGKTALAVRAAHLSAEEFPDGRLYVDLHGHTPGRAPLEPAAALELLLRGVSVPPERIPADLVDRAEQWRAELVGRRMLVVLDNAADVEQLRWLLPGSPGATVLATSRRRMSALDGARSLSLDLMDRQDAEHLFRSVVGDDRPSLDPVGTAEVIRSCAFLPLAIRIAGARLRHRPAWSVRYLADRLADEDRRLDELSTGERSVLAAFKVSYQHLDQAQSRMFRLLGLHAGQDFDVYAAACLAETTVIEAERALEELLDVNLLVQQRAGRYGFHDLLRRYALQTAHAEESEADRLAAVHRLARYYLDLSRACEQFIDTVSETERPGPISALPALHGTADASAAIATQHATLAATVADALAHGLAEPAWQLAAVVGPMLFRCGYLDLALRVFDDGLAAARAAQAGQAEMSLLRHQGNAFLAQARFDDALGALHRSLAIAPSLTSADARPRILSTIGVVHIRRGQYEQALDHLREAQSLLSTAPNQNPDDHVPVLVNLGVALTKLGRYREAAECHFEALTRVESGGNSFAEIAALINVGWTYMLDGQHSRGTDHLRRALARSQEAGAREAEARSHFGLAECLRRQGAFEQASRHARDGLLVARAIGDIDVEIDTLTALGDIQRAIAEPDSATESYYSALELIERSGQSFKAAVVYEGLGVIAAECGDRGQALSHWRRALAIAAEAGLPEATRIEGRLAACP